MGVWVTHNRGVAQSQRRDIAAVASVVRVTNSRVVLARGVAGNTPRCSLRMPRDTIRQAVIHTLQHQQHQEGVGHAIGVDALAR